jgi:dipeptidyl aminopeptidase/acylaminoacyl peptidase
VLLIHGDDDRNVPFQQTTDLVEKLRAQNVAFEELIIPDEIHDLLRWSRLGPRHRRILRPQIGFLRQTAISPPASLPEYFAVM